ncbi:adaptin N terminal region-domain-containing protein [Geopyxis carbonaria]|nr:adaptin N terminal region-domain-containing protein [Geopyxis carbonaria]
MFEKSLYDLIRGLRNNKGNERQYMVDSLTECRKEAKSQDLDLKATAILKLIYLDMFGHDMAWASFHALEVMSSPKFRQKRVGYLAAVQSFRLDTDVLMLTTNLIKKDLHSPSVPEMSLAINGLSHIVSPSLARDLAPDLVSKLGHSSPHIRKKAVLVLYKCFLQSPELLRTSWSRLRECLSDSDTSVVSATVNVVCELARRNPKNYLSLAPQLFKLLIDGGNNWMTIKLIKLFATLTPLEPRLVKKLIPPITNLIRTTPAMSLLYECINGLISGGLLAEMKDMEEGEELASVCVTKLRGFLVEGDSNLKYVGLLALTKLVNTHAHLVDAHQDVVLECIDDEDLSIRYRALELVVGMVNADNLPAVVGKLIYQLRTSRQSTQEANTERIEIDGDENDMEVQVVHPSKAKKSEKLVNELPEEYKYTIIERIISMCSRNMYSNISDFEWYLDVLLQLIRYAPHARRSNDEWGGDPDGQAVNFDICMTKDVGENIGKELQNVAIRVRSVRPEAVRCAELLLSRGQNVFPATGSGGNHVLGAAAWIAGEYSSLLSNPSSTLDYLIHPSSRFLEPHILAIYIQSAVKVYTSIASSLDISWIPARKSTICLLTDRVIRFLEPLMISPSLEIQEPGEAVRAQPAQYDPPLLLTQAIPSLFNGHELNPVAPKAQRKVPLPPGLDLDEPINPHVDSNNTLTHGEGQEDEEFRIYYYNRLKVAPVPSEPATIGIDSAAAKPATVSSYQGFTEEDYLDADIIARRRKERQERNRDDPFYIFAPGDTEGVTDADLENIPVLELNLDNVPPPVANPGMLKYTAKPKPQIEISLDETLEGLTQEMTDDEHIGTSIAKRRIKKRGLLQVDASGLVGYSLDDERDQEKDNSDILTAREEVERLRQEMKQAADRVAAQKVTVNKSKSKKKFTKEDGDSASMKKTKKTKKKTKKKLTKSEESNPKEITPMEGGSLDKANH